MWGATGALASDCFGSCFPLTESLSDEGTVGNMKAFFAQAALLFVKPNPATSSLLLAFPPSGSATGGKGGKCCRLAGSEWTNRALPRPIADRRLHESGWARDRSAAPSIMLCTGQACDASLRQVCSNWHGWLYPEA
jgi:hypothetical protein